MLWQSLATIILIACAATIIGRRIWQLAFAKSKGPCGGCGGCSGKDSSVAVQITPLVQLGAVSFVPADAKAKVDFPLANGKRFS